MKLLNKIALSVIFALGPVAAQEEKTNSSVLIVFDASGSMWGQIEGKAKIEIAREVVADLVRDLPAETELGLMAYGHRRKGDCADIELLIPVAKVNKSEFIKTVEDIMPKGMTPITASLQLAAEGMRYTEQKATVILVSDGLETCDADPCEAAKKLEKLGVDFTAHVIAFDLKPEETAKLECISKSTGGQFFPASDAESLKDALDFAIEETAPVAKAEEPEPPAPDRTATISAPDTAVAGSKVKVTWESQPIKGDYITIAEAGSEDDKNIGYKYTYEKDSVEITTMIEPGKAEIRYIAAKTGKVLARQPITLTEFEVTLKAPEEIVAGASIPVEWTGPDYPGDFITVVMKDTPEDKWAKYAYTRGGSPLKVLTPPTAGEAEIRYLAGNNRKLLARIPLTLTEPTATLKAPDEVVAGAMVPIEWTGPANKNDFITIVMKDTEEEKWAKYTYAKEEGTLKVEAPITSGEAEIRYIGGQDRKTLARIPITLTEAQVTLKAPSEVAVGTAVPVEWTGPANKNDFITIVVKGTAEDKWAKYKYAKEEGTLKVQAPMTAGEAEIRYVTGQDREVLARIPITLTEAQVTLKAPSEVVVGTAVPVEWTGPANKNDFITIVMKDTEEDKWEKYTYAREPGTLKVEAPMTAGEAEIRYLAGQDRSVLARIPITLRAADVTLKAPAEAVAGAMIPIEWTGPANKNDFITVVMKDTEEEKWAKYTYAKEEGTMKVESPITAGEAEIRYIAGQNRETLARIPIKLTEPVVKLEAPAEAPAGSKVEVKWTGPGNKNDFITIVPKGTEEGKSAKYAYAREEGTLSVEAPPEEGEAEIRYLTGQGRKTLFRIPIKITPAKE